ncbi:unnamed protein product [Ectocarpus sp. 12 AP-2014]
MRDSPKHRGAMLALPFAPGHIDTLTSGKTSSGLYMRCCYWDLSHTSGQTSVATMASPMCPPDPLTTTYFHNEVVHAYRLPHQAGCAFPTPPRQAAPRICKITTSIPPHPRVKISTRVLRVRFPFTMRTSLSHSW